MERVEAEDVEKERDFATGAERASRKERPVPGVMKTCTTAMESGTWLVGED